MSVHYDPMIAKLVVWGDDRTEAIRKADLALSQFNVGGVETNIDFMRRILQSTAFRTKPVTTSFIEENREELLGKFDLTPHQLAIATLALSAIQDYTKGETLEKRFRMNSGARSKFTLKDGEKGCEVQVETMEGTGFSVGALENCYVMRVEKNGNTYTMELQINDKLEIVTAALHENTLTLFTSVSDLRLPFFDFMLKYSRKRQQALLFFTGLLLQSRSTHSGTPGSN